MLGATLIMLTLSHFLLDVGCHKQTYVICDKPKDKRLVKSRWLFKLKEGINRVEAPRFKARLMHRGFTQEECVDFNEIYFQVVKHKSIWVMLSILANFNLELGQLDVEMTFLHRILDETIYIHEAT